MYKEKAKEVFGVVVEYARKTVPITYRSTYTDPLGKKHFTVWTEWLGCKYNVDDYVIGE